MKPRKSVEMIFETQNVQISPSYLSPYKKYKITLGQRHKSESDNKKTQKDWSQQLYFLQTSLNYSKNTFTQEG